VGEIKVVEDDFIYSRGQWVLFARLGRWSCFFGLGEGVDGVVLELCERVDLELEDVWRPSGVDIFLTEVVQHPSNQVIRFWTHRRRGRHDNRLVAKIGGRVDDNCRKSDCGSGGVFVLVGVLLV
jgi:hypothetical protein